MTASPPPRVVLDTSVLVPTGSRRALQQAADADLSTARGKCYWPWKVIMNDSSTIARKDVAGQVGNMHALALD